MADLLSGGTAVVTGAASGIGRATAIAYARDGCSNLLLGDLSVAGLEETRKLILDSYKEVKVEISLLDVADEEVVEQFFSKGVQTFGRVDFAANVAGYAHKAAPIHDLSESEYEKSYAVNQKGVFFCERAEIRQMLKQEPLPQFGYRGSIVNVTSLCATISINGLAAYSATKGGILGLTKTDALDYGPQNIRINAVAPGNTLTPMVVNAMPANHLDLFASMTPLRRNAVPEDIANAIVWLSSPRAAYITGISIPVDGGMNLQTGPP
ncbi:uncharacterized protein Z520_07748 [Fonsecaea multimorphosa CBS 102226]|uniref:Uncharacterized protein n=1 Tax=Fonsecaea multimorphosa CBS 102226 TaxID=1442371 RepID=A0A0D2JSN5_9EURO|nr:uncharacterized protein Z520_07748 [Fonsecaea multimorphosa CBS 102226]KIX96482.1 hypothetical protein Z520_07748 [Fonsecaea multimorphosa CBS 102226]OAL28317.1 hypothetical protein AYO22_03023 [Fonsecaea multimorphosa]